MRSSAQARLTAVGRVRRSRGDRGLEVLSPRAAREHDAVGGRDADGRRAADRETLDGLGHLLDVGQAQVFLAPREVPLVEQHDLAVARGQLDGRVASRR